MSNRNRTPRTAALFVSLAVAGSALTITPAANAAGTAPTTVVKRLSAAKGIAGEKVFVQGSKLATLDDKGTPATNDDVWTAKVVTFDALVDGVADVTATASALSEDVLVVTVPAHANGATQVLVGDALKGPKFTYAAAVTVSTLQAYLGGLAPISETGLEGVTIAGTNFTKSTKVLVGGKATKLAENGLAADGTSIKVNLPAGLWGIQDVVVSDPSKTYYVGYVTYAGKKPTISAATGAAYNEQASTVVLTGTNLNLITGATYEGVKTTFKVTKTDDTTLSVVIPKGADAVTNGKLKVTTKYGESATYDVSRVAAPVPAVSTVSAVTPATAGEVTLTGTNLTGLKKVVVKSSAGKLYSGSKINVVSASSAKVTLPALPAGDYTVSVVAISATPSTDKAFTVGTPAAPAPAVTSVTGAVAAGGEVTLVGTDLLGLSAVSVAPAAGGSAVTGTGITAVTATGAKVTLPALTAGSYKMTVTATSGVSAAFTFTVA